jgi:endo-1,4-beta-mannosidase
VRATAPLGDFLGPHVYRMETDRVRLHLGPAFVCELAAFAGKPVVLEEFGSPGTTPTTTTWPTRTPTGITRSRCTSG